MDNLIDFNLQPNKIIIYTRVSTKSQANDEKYGLTSQENVCIKYVETFYPDYKTIIITDVGSSFNNKYALKNLDNMIDDLEQNTLIIVSEASRLGRNTLQSFQALEDIRLKKSYIISISEQICFGKIRNLDTRFKEKLLSAEESSVIAGDRQKNVIKYIRENGGHWGSAPFGFMVSKNENKIPVLVENPEHQKIINQIDKLIDNDMTILEITKYCTARNLLGKKKWYTSTVKKIVSNLGKKKVADSNNVLNKLTNNLNKTIITRKR